MRHLAVHVVWTCLMYSRLVTPFHVVEYQRRLSRAYRSTSLGSLETTRDIDDIATNDALKNDSPLDLSSKVDLVNADVAAEPIDPKEAVKIFGRLAEKYIALDSSGGMCCYSACTDCEFRLPGGGYIMADQSASRPKWIPHYDTRNSNNKAHVTKWSTKLFAGTTISVSKDEFVTTLRQLDYSPPLGGPYVGSSAATIDNVAAMERFFDVLADGKTKLTKNRMSVRLKQLANGEEGMTWQAFERVMGLV